MFGVIAVELDGDNPYNTKIISHVLYNYSIQIEIEVKKSLKPIYKDSSDEIRYFVYVKIVY